MDGNEPILIALISALGIKEIWNIIKKKMDQSATKDAREDKLSLQVILELKEKVNCPDCGKEVTVHGLKYTHKRYCKSIQPEPTTQVARGPELQPQPSLTTEPFVPTEEQ